MGSRLTEENLEETDPLGVKVCVCGCEREDCYFNPELASGCHTKHLPLPPVAPVC